MSSVRAAKTVNFINAHLGRKTHGRNARLDAQTSFDHRPDCISFALLLGLPVGRSIEMTKRPTRSALSAHLIEVRREWEVSYDDRFN